VFKEIQVYDGYKAEDKDAYAALMASIGPSIALSPRKAAETKPDENKLRGKVVKFNDMRGFGWIVCTDNSELFVHIRDCKGVSTLFTDQSVTYEVGADRKGKPIAVKVEVVR
jgi:cold shock CspA family protein